MNAFSFHLRNLFLFLLICVLALAAFGLLLALFQALLPDASVSLELGLTLLSAALAFVAGGYLAARLHTSSGLGHSQTFGLLFGGASFAYILGLTWSALLATVIAWALAATGGWLQQRRKSIS